MRAAVRSEDGQVSAANVPDAEVKSPSDALVRVVLSAVCGTDLWGLRGFPAIPPGPRAGQGFIGVVEDIGADVRFLKPGNVLLAPFWWSDGTCVACKAGLPTSCPNGGMQEGGQGEAVRVSAAAGTVRGSTDPTRPRTRRHSSRHPRSESAPRSCQPPAPVPSTYVCLDGIY
ncbi:alcohol dehydrogenase catalytic domain-containing protein [Streptomyces violaceusniger]|uniref:Alcohol dehydrogenase-like N-terminal domain-containing protein n=1 Tax=Streptomyces violaceusniger TaxID=68280 RepID=A0A4D4KPU8_STRVO|nr:hypothetical protein SVIO_008370 [Streptomyces violaceusniger]